jgi:hypothetical protein
MLRDRFVRPPSTRARWLYAIAGGCLPIVCLLFDPIIFRGNPDSVATQNASYGAYRAFGYVATVLACALLLRAVLSRRIATLETGMLYGAAAVSLTLGILILPLALFGSFFEPIALLGFSPLLASAAYARYSGYHHVAQHQRLLSPAALLGALLFLAIPTSVQLGTNAAVESAIATANAPVLRRLAPLYDAEILVRRYTATESSAEQQRLAAAYEAMTGEMIEIRLAQIASD